MSEKRQLHLGAFMRPATIHTGGWRYPGAAADANFNFPQMKTFTQKLEAARFDAFFMADHLAVLNMPMEALKRSATPTSFEPFTLLPALAEATEHIGLVATGSTTYDEPYHVARRFASLDHISGGRAGWNIVTTSNPDTSLNFGLEEALEHSDRYARAREFYDVVTGLWDSWADDAFLQDQESGIYFDPEKLHVLDHKGKYFSVRGPLNIARPIQGWPLIVQAGSSDAGRQLAAETAEAVFTSHSDLAAGQQFYTDVKARAREGRTRRRSYKNPAGMLRGDRRYSRRSARETGENRQPGPFRQRDRVAVDCPRPRRLEVRSRRAAARHSRKQRQQERARARHQDGRAGGPDGAPARAAARRLFRRGHGGGRPRPSPTKWQNGSRPAAATALP